jgi:hypothetical protein
VPHTAKAKLYPYEPARGLAHIRGLPCPPYRSCYRPRRLAPDDRRAALRGEFVLAPGAARADGAARRDRLVPPIDWSHSRQHNHRWSGALHTLIWLDPLCQLHANCGSVDALSRALDVAVDWARGNDPERDGLSPFAWSELIVAVRAPHLAYTLRAALAAGICDDDDARLLLSCLVSHGEYLCARKNYASRNNHGLFQDIGLALLAEYLPGVPGASRWAALSSERFAASLAAAVNVDEGVYLEHTIGYHFWMRTIFDHVATVAPQISAGIDLPALVEKMTLAGLWFVAADRRMPQIGDTYHRAPQKWALKRMHETAGLKLFPESGYAVVRDGGSYLIVTAGFHSRVHKHADDGSFCLYEDREQVVGEAGKFGYGRNLPARRYARRANAHNVVVVDGDTARFLTAPPYGSGIRAAATCGDFHAIEIENPALEELGVAHRRLLLYRPGIALVVIDDVRSAEPHDYTRYLQLGASIEITNDGAGGPLSFEGERVAGRIVHHAADPVTRTLVRGEREPHLQGWTFPQDRLWRPNWCVQEDVHTTDFLSAFAIQATRDTRVEVRDIRAADTALTVELELDGDPLAASWDRSQPSPLRIVSNSFRATADPPAGRDGSGRKNDRKTGAKV